MDAKEIKSCLKAAREAIRTKDFETAAKNCKAILEVDKKNYNAMVFMGVASEGLNQIEEAVQVYRKAVEATPDQPLAWQGFGSLLEKHPTVAPPQESIQVFKQLLTFSESDEGKTISLLHKLGDLYMSTSMHELAYKTVQRLLATESEDEGRLASCSLMVDLFNNEAFETGESHIKQYFKCLDELLNNPSLDAEKLNKYIINMLHATAKHNLGAFPGKIEEMRKKFPSAEACLETSIQFELERSVGEISTSHNGSVQSVEPWLQSLKEVNAQNQIVSIAEAFLAFQKKSFLQAKKSFTEINSGSPVACYYLAKASLALHNSSLSLDSCVKGLTACANPTAMFFVPVISLSDSLKLLQAEALRSLGSIEDLTTAIEILAELKERKPIDAGFLLAHCYLDQGKVQEAEICINQLPQDSEQVKLLRALLLIENENYSEAIELLRLVVKGNPDNALATLTLGKALWKVKDSDHIENVKQLCFNTLLKAAKLDPNNYESFLYLGHFYHVIQKDSNKAKRCFQKAHDLNPAKEDAACALVDSLLEMKEEEQAVKILKEVTSKASAGRGKWAWLRLGLYQIKCEDPTVAIASLQSALRADPKDHHIWECLAEAYLHRGSLTAALKAFTKASELKPDSVYCLYQIASVRQTLGLLPQAIEEYKQILEKEQNYVPALKGLGESLVLLARQNLSQCLDGLAQDCCEEALVYLSRAASQRSDFACLWKLMGDACNIVYKMASDSYSVPSKMLPKGTQFKEATTHVTKMQMLEIGSRCYSAAIKILPENASYWHDLGVSLYRQSEETIRKEIADSYHSVGLEQLERAKKAIQKSLTLEPSSWQHWNALGVMACSKVNYKPAFAQHCFIKSLESEANNVLAWSNLGSLYLKEDQIQMAHNAFKAAQRLDPTYVVGWIGQALIAEIVGHEEVMDLFRHTTDLAVHPESQLGYGQFVLEVLRDESKLGKDLFNYCIHQMAAIPNASDALIKYTTRFKTDAIAYNMLGLLFEHQNLLESSIEALKKSLMLLTDNDPRNVKIDVEKNYARILCKSGKYKESVEQFSLIGPYLDFDHQCLYALAEYKCSNYLQSLKMYGSCLEQLAEGDPRRCHIYTALGMVAFKAGDMDEAKSQLFSGFQTESPSFHGLLALCSLGLLQQDMTLASAVLNELGKRPESDSLSAQTTVLRLYAHVLQGSKTEGECMLREMLEQKVPNSSDLWSLLAGYLVMTFNHLGASAVECVRSTTDACQPLELKNIIIESVAQLQAGQHNSKSTSSNAFKTAQKAFHQNPEDVRTMCVLASASHAEGILRKSTSNGDSLFVLEKALLAAVMEREKEDDHMICWCLKQLTLCSIELGNMEETKEYLKQLKKHFPDTAIFVAALEMYLSSSMPADLSASQLTNLDFLSLMVAISFMGNNKQYQAMTDFLSHLKESDKTQCRPLSKTNLFELLTHKASSSIQDSLDETSELKKAFEDSLSFSKEKELVSPILSLLHGINCFSTNKRLSKNRFATALDQSQSRSDNGISKSLARQGLIYLLWDSTKESDVNLVQALLADAKQDGDKVTVTIHAQLSKK